MIGKDEDSLFAADEQMRYRKKSQKKAPKKINHRHEFADCVLQYNGMRLDKAHGFVYDDTRWRMGRYCIICGKIGDSDAEWRERWTADGRKYLFAENWNDAAKREFDPKTRTLPCFMLKDNYGFDKFVDLGGQVEG